MCMQCARIRPTPTALPQAIAYLFLNPMEGRKRCLCFANSVYGIASVGERGDNEYSVQLYRTVSQEELNDIALFNGFRPGSGCMETKLFATSAADAAF